MRDVGSELQQEGGGVGEVRGRGKRGSPEGKTGRNRGKQAGTGEGRRDGGGGREEVQDKGCGKEAAEGSR